MPKAEQQHVDHIVLDALVALAYYSDAPALPARVVEVAELDPDIVVASLKRLVREGVARCVDGSYIAAAPAWGDDP